MLLSPAPVAGGTPENGDLPHALRHAAAGGFIAADVEQINTETMRFLDIVTQRGERLR